MDSKCFLTSTALQTRRARCQHQLSFLFDLKHSSSYRVHGKIRPNWPTRGFSAI